VSSCDISYARNGIATGKNPDKKVGAPSARVSGRRALPDESGNPGVHQVSRVVSASVRRVWTPNTANSSNAAVGETARRRLRDHTGPPPKGGPYVVRL